MVKKVFPVILCLVIVTVTTVCFAASAGIDKQQLYDEGRFLEGLGDYSEALRIFEMLDGYRDSSGWKYYCEGMILIDEANESESKGCISIAKKQMEEAYARFQMLSAGPFENSEKLKIYCTARLDELKGLYQPALDLYAGLFGTEDSDARYFRLTDGKYLPTQAPDCPEDAPMLPPIPAHVSRRTDAFMGPGANYPKQSLVSLEAGTPCAIIAKEGNYYMVELPAGAGRIRCWVSTIRILRDENRQEPETGKKKRNGYMLEEENGVFGPGDDYAKSNAVIPKGTKIVIFEDEGTYTMIETVPVNGSAAVRLWVPTRSVTKQ